MLNVEILSKYDPMRKTKKHYVDIKHHEVEIKKRESIEGSLTVTFANVYIKLK